MKKNILLILLAIPFFLFSQSKLVPGFIIKTNGDSTKGFLKQVPEKKADANIYFAETNSASPSLFTTKDIQGFGYDEGNTFYKINYVDPTDLSRHERFAKKLVEGNNRLYTFWQRDRQFFILNTYEDSTYLLYDDVYSPVSGITNEKSNYRQKLLFLSVNCDAVKASVDNLLYSQSEMAKYVDQLNKCTSPSENNQIVYKKDKSYLNIYAYAGGIVLGKKHEFTGRIIAKFTLPSIDKNMSVNVGLNYMANKRSYIVQNPYNYIKTEKIQYRNIYSIPFTVQYNLIQGRIKPYIDAGLSLDYLERNGQMDFSVKKTHDTELGVGFIVAAGIEGYITNRLMIKAEWRYELFVHYPTIGIGYIFK